MAYNISKELTIKIIDYIMLFDATNKETAEAFNVHHGIVSQAINDIETVDPVRAEKFKSQRNNARNRVATKRYLNGNFKRDSEIACYIIENHTTTKQTAEHFGFHVNNIKKRLVKLSEHDKDLAEKALLSLDEANKLQQKQSGIEMNNKKWGKNL